TDATPSSFSEFGSTSDVTFQTLVNREPSPASTGTWWTSWKTASAPAAKLAIEQEFPSCMLVHTKVGPPGCVSATIGGWRTPGISSESTTLVASPGPKLSTTMVKVMSVSWFAPGATVSVTMRSAPGTGVACTVPVELSSSESMSSTVDTLAT